MGEPSVDDLVAGGMIATLKNEIPQAFGRADMQLRRDDKKFKSSRGVTSVPESAENTFNLNFSVSIDIEEATTEATEEVTGPLRSYL
jgi:hypothetical protein